MHFEPARSIIEKLGGLSAVSKIVEVTPHSVLRWRLPKRRGGTGGFIPHWHAVRLLDAAERAGVELSAADFMPRLEPDAHTIPDPAIPENGNRAEVLP